MEFRPIGYVRHGLPDEEVRRSRVDAVIEISPEFQEGLKGLEEFTHIIVISFLHKFRGAPLVVTPKRIKERGLEAPEAVGVFATDSPDRPNPIGVSIVRLLRVEGNKLYVSGIDLYDGTPVLDIKGFSPSRCPANAKAPRWALADV